MTAVKLPVPTQLFLVCSPRPLFKLDGFGSLDPLHFSSRLTSPLISTLTSLNFILLAVDFEMILL